MMKALMKNSIFFPSHSQRIQILFTILAQSEMIHQLAISINIKDDDDDEEDDNNVKR